MKQIKFVFSIMLFLFLLILSGCILFTDKDQSEFENIIVYYVSTSGNDSNPGTKNFPKLTIQNAIDNAVLPSEIHVAQGTYDISSQINMKNGVSIMGGYSSGFSARNITTYITKINDTRDTGSLTIRTIYCDGISSSTKIDGFTIVGGTEDYSTGIYIVNSSLTISNNNIDGGNSIAQTNGIHNDTNAYTIIKNNIIYGGDGPYSYGIYNTMSYSTIVNNLISGGFSLTAGSESSGIIDYTDSNSIIVNNTINGGESENSTGIVFCNNSSPIIRNNIIFTTGGTTREGIYDQSTFDPISIRNNCIFDCPTALYNMNGTLITNLAITSFTTGEGFNTLSGFGNVSVDMINPNYYFVYWDGIDNNVLTLTDNNWHLTTSCPASVRTGGLTLTIKTDKDGNKRTVPWSIGAYEKD